MKIQVYFELALKGVRGAEAVLWYENDSLGGKS